MKFLQATTLALTTSLCSARFIEKYEANQVSLNSVQDESLYRIELSPGETRLVTEEQKWELKRKNVNFMDITDIEDPASLPQLVTLSTSGKKFPEKPTLSKQIKPLLETLSKLEMKNHLEIFSGFHTRYYNSKYGAESSKWLLGVVNKIIVDAKADHNGASVRHFKHPWGQNSIIANFPGKSNKTIVIGAHQDSINLFFPSFLAAPGADDDGSGTVTILEAMRVLLTSKDFIEGNAENTVEFHWYSAEEGGMLGSQAVFQDYRKAGRDVRAMLQQDMTGYIQKTLDAGEKEHVGIITDFVDPDLTDYIKKIVTEYADIPYTETKCGYACSDHSSASKFGYPSAFVIESDFKYSERPQIHTTDDTIKYLDFDHMLQHAKLTLGFVYELAYAQLL